VSVDGRGGGAPGDHDVKTTFVGESGNSKSTAQTKHWSRQETKISRESKAGKNDALLLAYFENPYSIHCDGLLRSGSKVDF